MLNSIYFCYFAYMFFFYKHMKLRNQARLCLAIYNFEVRIMLCICLTFQGTRLPV